MSALRTRVMLRDAIRLMAEARPENSPKKTKAGTEMTGAAAEEVPEEFRKPQLNFNKIILWPKSVAKVPYAKSEGVGPGERRLAKILGGEVMGGSATFDLSTPYGKFEVKEPTGGWYGGIRVESEGIAAIEANLSKIKNAAKKIDMVFGTGAKPDMVAAAKEMYPAETLQKIVDFATKPETKGQTAIQWILRGEIGAKRLKALGDTLLLIHSGLMAEGIIRLARRVQQVLGEEKFVTMDDSETGVDVKQPVDTATFVKVGKALGVSAEEMKVSPADMLRSALSGQAFTNPDEFINNVVTEPVTASQVFGHTDGLILVQPQGYMIIPKSDLTKMQFLRISKGKPYFRLAGGGGSEED